MSPSGSPLACSFTSSCCAAACTSRRTSRKPRCCPLAAFTTQSPLSRRKPKVPRQSVPPLMSQSPPNLRVSSACIISGVTPASAMRTPMLPILPALCQSCGVQRVSCRATRPPARAKRAVPRLTSSGATTSAAGACNCSGNTPRAASASSTPCQRQEVSVRAQPPLAARLKSPSACAERARLASACSVWRAGVPSRSS